MIWAVNCSTSSWIIRLSVPLNFDILISFNFMLASAER